MALSSVPVVLRKRCKVTKVYSIVESIEKAGIVAYLNFFCHGKFLALKCQEKFLKNTKN